MDCRRVFWDQKLSATECLSVSDLLLLIHATVAELQSRFFVPPPVAEHSDIEA